MDGVIAGLVSIPPGPDDPDPENESPAKPEKEPGSDAGPEEERSSRQVGEEPRSRYDRAASIAASLTAK
jgi:hypothetical protein